MSIKHTYDISCNWFANNADINGKKQSFWTGKILTQSDNGLIGIATDAGSASPTHILIGVLVAGKGISIVKLNQKNPEIDPIYYDAFKNASGEKNALYGEFLTTTFGGLVPQGQAKFVVSPATLSKEETANVSTTFENGVSDIEKTMFLSNAVLQDMLSQDKLDLSQKIQLLSQAFENNPLSEKLLSASFPQLF